MTDEELIRKVAEEVMGWKLRNEYYYLPEETDFYKPIYYVGEFDPLTNLNHAFMVVEKMRKLGWSFSMFYGTDENGMIDEWACFEKGKFSSKMYGSPTGHAICVAALKAVENG